MSHKIHIFWMPQSNNIAFGIDEDLIDYDKMNKAISLSQNKEFISNLPDGINTVVGDRGVRISEVKNKELVLQGQCITIQTY